MEQATAMSSHENRDPPTDSDNGIESEGVLRHASLSESLAQKNVVQITSSASSISFLHFLGDIPQSRDGLFFFKAVTKSDGRKLNIHDLVRVVANLSEGKYYSRVHIS